MWSCVLNGRKEAKKKRKLYRIIYSVVAPHDSNPPPDSVTLHPLTSARLLRHRRCLRSCHSFSYSTTADKTSISAFTSLSKTCRPTLHSFHNTSLRAIFIPTLTSSFCTTTNYRSDPSLPSPAPRKKSNFEISPCSKKATGFWLSLATTIFSRRPRLTTSSTSSSSLPSTFDCTASNHQRYKAPNR